MQAGIRLVNSVAEQDHHWQIRHAPCEKEQEIQRGIVGPVEVLENDQRGTGTRDSNKKFVQGVEQLVPLLLWIGRGSRTG